MIYLANLKIRAARAIREVNPRFAVSQGLPTIGLEDDHHGSHG
jgi:hypothetical protein